MERGGDSARTWSGRLCCSHWFCRRRCPTCFARHDRVLIEDESSSRRCTSAVIEMVCTHRGVPSSKIDRAFDLERRQRPRDWCQKAAPYITLVFRQHPQRAQQRECLLVLVVLRWPASGTHACGECNDGTPRSAKLWLLTPPLWRMSINAQRRIRASLASARATGAARASNVHPRRVWPRAPLPLSFEGWGRLRKVRFWSWPTHR